MAKSVFEQTKNLLKSLTGSTSGDTDDDKENKDKNKPDEQSGTPPTNAGDGNGSNDGDGTGNINGEDGKTNEKSVNKSLPDGYDDATDVLCNLVSELKKSNETVEALTKRIADLEAGQADISKSVLEVAGNLATVANTPLPKKSATSVQKSDVGNGNAGNGVFTVEDWNIAKSVLTSAVKAKDISLEKSEMLSSACQKALHGGQMSREVWSEMSVLCKKYASS